MVGGEERALKIIMHCVLRVPLLEDRDEMRRRRGRNPNNKQQKGDRENCKNTVPKRLRNETKSLKIWAKGHFLFSLLQVSEEKKWCVRWGERTWPPTPKCI